MISPNATKADHHMNNDTLSGVLKQLDTLTAPPNGTPCRVASIVRQLDDTNLKHITKAVKTRSMSLDIVTAVLRKAGATRLARSTLGAHLTGYCTCPANSDPLHGIRKATT